MSGSLGRRHHNMRGCGRGRLSGKDGWIRDVLRVGRGERRSIVGARSPGRRALA